MKTPKKRETGIYIIRVLTKISPQKPAYIFIYMAVHDCTVCRLAGGCSEYVKPNIIIVRGLVRACEIETHPSVRTKVVSRPRSGRFF